MVEHHGNSARIWMILLDALYKTLCCYEGRFENQVIAILLQELNSEGSEDDAGSRKS